MTDGDDDVGSFPGPYPKPFERDWSKWNDAVSAERVSELQRQGWTVIDGFLQGGGGAGDGGDCGAWASALREEIKWLATTGLMRPNRTHFANPKVRSCGWKRRRSGGSTLIAREFNRSSPLFIFSCPQSFFFLWAPSPSTHSLWSR